MMVMLMDHIVDLVHADDGGGGGGVTVVLGGLGVVVVHTCADAV